MESVPSLALIALIASVLGSGCTNADREMAKKKSDGTETFKYELPPAIVNGSRSSSNGSRAIQKNTAPEKEDVGTAETPPNPSSSRNQKGSFEYKPSRRVLQQMSNN